MANFPAIRTALQTRLKSIGGLNVYATWPDQLATPAAIIRPVGGEYEQSFGKGPAVSNHRFEVQLYVSAAGGIAQGQANLDPYLSTSTTGSIYGAIDADRTLAGAVYSTFVRSYRDYGPQGGDEASPPAYMGVVVEIEVQTS